MREFPLLSRLRERVAPIVTSPWARALPWVALGVAALLVAMFAASAAGVTCGGCHASAKAAPADKGAGPHASLACASCHAADGVQRTALGLHGSAAVVFAASTAAPGLVDDAACLGCHMKVLGAPVSRNGMRIDHARCIERAGGCVSCHRRAVHATKSGPPGVPVMDDCLGCHASIERPEGCDLCHEGKGEGSGSTPWSVTHGPNWKLTHGAGDLTTCGFCHKAGTTCTDCHVDMPHPDGWARIHGTGVTPKREACISCHTNAFCDGCHGMPMPHAETWLKDHTTQTKGRTDPLCSRCHLQEDCAACHVAHTHPGRVRGP